MSAKGEERKNYLRMILQKEKELSPLKDKLRELLNSCQDLNQACFRVAGENGNQTLLQEAENATIRFQQLVSKIDVYNTKIQQNESEKAKLISQLLTQKKALSKLQSKSHKNINFLKTNENLKEEINNLKEIFHKTQKEANTKRKRNFEENMKNSNLSQIGEKRKAKKILMNLKHFKNGQLS